jgi:hypothetical protein
VTGSRCVGLGLLASSLGLSRMVLGRPILIRLGLVRRSGPAIGTSTTTTRQDIWQGVFWVRRDQSRSRKYRCLL